MRVFISWSGERSHNVAIALKSFIGDIIQSVTPFVSDEDIISGERWNTRLQEELQENQYGILSITHDNKESPWLLFEAGALSNSPHKIPVVPFLFDIKPSELTGSPLLQFQASIYYNKTNVKKLINDINDACGDNKLDSNRLERAFDRCYDEFESALKKITPETDKPQNAESDKTRVILEELLDLTRGNQRFLNNDISNYKMTERLENLIDRLDTRTGSSLNAFRRSGKRRFHPMMFEELLHIGQVEPFMGYAILIVLSLYKDDLPWLYDAGKDYLDIMKSDYSFDRKQRAYSEFQDLIDFTFHNPLFTIESNNKEDYMALRELPILLTEYFERYVIQTDNLNEIERPIKRSRKRYLDFPNLSQSDE